MSHVSWNTVPVLSAPLQGRASGTLTSGRRPEEDAVQSRR